MNHRNAADLIATNVTDIHAGYDRPENWIRHVEPLSARPAAASSSPPFDVAYIARAVGAPVCTVGETRPTLRILYRVEWLALPDAVVLTSATAKKIPLAKNKGLAHLASPLSVSAGS
jgi:hypothetical protein